MIQIQEASESDDGAAPASPLPKAQSKTSGMSPRKSKFEPKKKKGKHKVGKKKKVKKGRESKRTGNAHDDLDCDFCNIGFGEPDPRVAYIKQQEMKAGKGTSLEDDEDFVIETVHWGRYKFSKPHGNQCYCCRRLHFFDPTYNCMKVAELKDHLAVPENKTTWDEKQEKVIIALAKRGTNCKLSHEDFETTERLTIYDRVGEEEYTEGTKYPLAVFNTRFPPGPKRPTNIKKDICINDKGKPEVVIIVMDDVAGVSRVKQYRDKGLNHEKVQHSGVNAAPDEVENLFGAMHNRDYQKGRYDKNLTAQELVPAAPSPPAGSSSALASPAPSQPTPKKSKTPLMTSLVSSDEEAPSPSSEDEAPIRPGGKDAKTSKAGAVVACVMVIENYVLHLFVFMLASIH